MGQLKISCDRLVQLLEHHQFAFMKNVEKVDTQGDTLNIQIQASLVKAIGLQVKPVIKVRLKSFSGGCLYVKADARALLKLAARIAGIMGQIDKELKKPIGQYIKREKGFSFKIMVDPFLATVLKGLEVRDVRLMDGALVVDF